MKKYILTITAAALLSTSLISCKEDSKLDKLEDELEQRSDDLEDASDDIGDVANDVESALENFKEALKEVENKEDRDLIRQRVNTIFDEMEMEQNKDMKEGTEE
ncbi:hypothetical protein [Nonlabens marinus]|uniref:Lipoprotein n=1 Tax=Nonlabens marinus S1-08 TaxID=1454201 RepID=W8VWI5_9FLAO|nr:hypothetical protein [Nonlabens marinus]BAO56373.1 hypothetical protein NMS_2364 [Nonlabens marinus S1-08]